MLQFAQTIWGRVRRAMSTLNRLNSKFSQVLQPEPLTQQVLRLSPDELKDQFQKTSEIINSTVFVLVGFCFFCALALSGPDAKLLSADPSIELPFVSKSRFLSGLSHSRAAYTRGLAAIRTHIRWTLVASAES